MTESWQPIETAPKDGTSVLLLSKEYTDHHDIPGEPHEIHHPAKCAIGAWDPEGDSWTDEYGQLGGEDVCMLTVTGTWSSGGGWFQPNEVTHWMPLPEPPND